MCGEHKDGLIFVDLSSGSSPHVRGAQEPGAADRDIDGIIPACAGSTVHGTPAMPPSWDHPRMCGEHETP